MSTDRDVTRIVRSWLHEDAHEDADRILNLVLDEIDTTPQRRASWLARRFPIMNNSIVRLGIAAAAVVLAVIVGINLLPGGNTGGPDATPSPSAQSSPVSLPFTTVPKALEAGRYRLLGGTWAPIDLTLTVPAGWNQDGLGVLKNPDSDTGLSLQAWVVTQVYTDTCAAEGQLVPIGPSVDDLVNALEALGGAEVSPPVESMVGGSPAKRVDISFSETMNLGDCRVPALQVWKDAEDENYNAGVPGSSQSIYVLDADGQTVAIVTGGTTTTASASDLAELEAIMASIQIEPAP